RLYRIADLFSLCHTEIGISPDDSFRPVSRRDPMPILLNESTPLERYTHNLTILAQQGDFAPLSGEDVVIDRVFHVAGRRNKNVPVILGDEGRRWAIV